MTSVNSDVNGFPAEQDMYIRPTKSYHPGKNFKFQFQATLIGSGTRRESGGTVDVCSQCLLECELQPIFLPYEWGFAKAIDKSGLVEK
ncbi:transposon protein [Echinococcus multilocularis]|uniref:Transposon protein n=1 Tax=Echinococcus multilocularis TaxID=6211 RepID=A0A0S4MLN6_ECHMU|nr:transposon protein [Echinococcus multilocularis]